MENLIVSVKMKNLDIVLLFKAFYLSTDTYFPNIFSQI